MIDLECYEKTFEGVRCQLPLPHDPNVHWATWTEPDGRIRQVRWLDGFEMNRVPPLPLVGRDLT